MTENVAVIGAGSWGTALAMVLADNRHNVKLWARRADQVIEINNKHTNEKYLPSIKLPEVIKATESLEEAVKDVSMAILVIPTKALRSVVKELNECIASPITIIHGTKGIEPKTSKRVSEMIIEEMVPDKLDGVGVLSGPSHAEEVSLRQPTTVAVSSSDMEVANRGQDLFNNLNFRVYTNEDIVGVEIGGSLKNIIALGAGISDGLGYGDNAKAALITRGLAEISRLGITLGADPLTFTGLAGMGDLIATCTSTHSRNWRCGNFLGQGLKLDEVLEKIGMAVEGVRTTEAAKYLADDIGVDMPITSAIYEILFNEKDPKTAVDDLMGRDPRHETGDIKNMIMEKDS